MPGQLIELTKKVTRESGIRLIVSEATSDFSFRALSRTGFKKENTLQYRTFKIEGNYANG